MCASVCDVAEGKKGDARDVIKERMIFLSDVLSACACQAADPRVFVCIACIYTRL